MKKNNWIQGRAQDSNKLNTFKMQIKNKSEELSLVIE